jgi:hypothetical protein
MSDGGIAEGQTFWATININGNLSQEELREALDEIRVLLSKEGRNGNVVRVLRTDSDEPPDVSEMKPAKQ